MHFEADKRLFHIVVHMSDAPGSTSTILKELGSKVNLIGISTYTLSDGTAMLACFAEALSEEETPGKLEKLISRLKATVEVEVYEGRGGLLVDTFHTGIQVGKDEYLLIRRRGMAGVFDHIVKIFGTGGEVLLFEEGKALGRDNSRIRVEELGRERVVDNAAYLGRILTAEGWGLIESTSRPDSNDFFITVTDCFECSAAGTVRKGCDFMRGFYEGSVEVTRGTKPRVEEVECTLRGGKNCVFRITV